MGEWEPLDLFEGSFAGINPEGTSARQSVFIADGSITDAKVADVSVRKLRGVGIKVYRGTSTQSIATATDDDIDFNAVAFNEGFQEPTGATFNTVTVPYPGVYIIASSIEWASNSTGGRNNRIKVNGSVVERAVYQASSESAITVTAIRKLEAGDTVGVGVRQSSGGALTLSAGEDNTSLTVAFLFPI